MKRASKGIKPKRRNRILLFFLLSIALISAVILVSIYIDKSSVTPDDVIVKDVQLDEHEALLFSLVNYRKVPMNCVAVMTVTDSEDVLNYSRLFLTLEKPMGKIKPKQTIRDKFTGFALPVNIQSWLHVTPNCSEV